MSGITYGPHNNVEGVTTRRYEASGIAKAFEFITTELRRSHPAAAQFAMSHLAAFGIRGDQTEISLNQYITIDQALAGDRPDISRDARFDLRMLTRNRPATISPITLALLGMNGVDPHCAMLLALFNAHAMHSLSLQFYAADGSSMIWVNVKDENPRLTRSERPRHIRTAHATISQSVTWIAEELIIDGLPESMSMHMCGRPLADVVEHSAFAHPGIAIAAVRDVDILPHGVHLVPINLMGGSTTQAPQPGLHHGHALTLSGMPDPISVATIP